MASLYIKDGDVNALAERLARRLGTSKTDTVRRALSALERSVPNRPTTAALLADLDTWRARHPLRESGKEADKTFFDRMWDDPD